MNIKFAQEELCMADPRYEHSATWTRKETRIKTTMWYGYILFRTDKFKKNAYKVEDPMGCLNTASGGDIGTATL